MADDEEIRSTLRGPTLEVGVTDPPKIGWFWVFVAILWTLGTACGVGQKDLSLGVLVFFGNAFCFGYAMWTIRHRQIELFDGTRLDDSNPRFWHAIGFMLMLGLAFVNLCTFVIANYQPGSSHGRSAPFIAPRFPRR